MHEVAKLESKRGSVLIAVLIFVMILGGFGVPAYLKLSASALSMADRNYYQLACMNLAEAGIEYGLWEINQSATGGAAWSGWYIAGADARRTYTNFAFKQGVQGNVKVYVFDYKGGNTTIVARAEVQPPVGGPVQRWLKAEIRQEGRKLFTFGLLVKDYIHVLWNGNSTFDSWVSNPDNDFSTPYVPYSTNVRNDNVSIAAATKSMGAIVLGSSSVYGYAYVGSSDPYALEMGWGGQVGPLNPNEWDPKDTTDLWKVDGRKVATGYLLTDFTAEFESIEAPEEISEYRGSYLLPYGAASIGVAGESRTYSFNSLTVQGDGTLTVKGDVTFVLPNAGKTLQIIQGGKIRLADGNSSLAIYLAGDAVISGAGLLNNLSPHQTQIWGTSGNRQKIDFQGSGAYSGLIYAPNADITLPGGTNIYGSVVANSLTLQGSGSFHYDESLKDYAIGGQSGKRKAMESLEELMTPEDRAPFISFLNFQD